MSDHINQNIIDLIKHDSASALKGQKLINQFQTKVAHIEHYEMYGMQILTIDSVAQSVIDLNDDTILQTDYIEEISQILLPFLGNPKTLMNPVVHLGVCAGALARWIYHYFPSQKQFGIDVDAQLIEYARNELNMPPASLFKVRIGLAESEIDNIKDNSCLSIIRDVFAGAEPPESVRMPEFIKKCLQKLIPGGILILNIIDFAHNSELANAELKTVQNKLNNLEINCKPQLRRIGKNFKKGEFTNYLICAIIPPC